MKTALPSRYLLRLAALLGCCCFCDTARAQSVYEIDGVVYGPNSQPLAAVTVTLENASRAQIGQQITTSDGRYNFSGVIAGNYYIVARPSDKQLQQAVHRLELINTTRTGSISARERVDIMIGAVPRPATAAAGVVFAQQVPAAAAAEYERAMESLGKKDRALATQRLQRALKIFPDYFAASQQLGLLYVEGEQFREALPPLVKAVAVNPKAAPSYLGLGIASLNLGRPDLSLQALEHAVRLDVKSYRVHFYRGLAFADLNRLDEAVTALREAHKLGGPGKASGARLHLASIYSKRGQNREAAAELEAYLSEQPNAPNAANVREAIKKLKAKS